MTERKSETLCKLCQRGNHKFENCLRGQHTEEREEKRVIASSAEDLQWSD